MKNNFTPLSILNRIILFTSMLCIGLVQINAQVYSFTNAGATGNIGPTQAQINATYVVGNTLSGAVTSVNGIQEWTVPATGLYSIKVAGAKGGGAGGGNGAVMSGEFMLTQGHVIRIAVGQRGTLGAGAQGSLNSGGGGGGSFVVNKTTNTILLIAGGGGGGNGDYGSSYPNTAGNPASTSTSGNSTNQGGGGINGNGGKNGIADDPAAGGGGYYSNGESSPPSPGIATGGFAFVNGAQGGSGRVGTYFGGNGGFGGGGGGTSNVLVRGGGGGGYSGGQGGTYQVVQTTVYTSFSDRGHGAGGGSINNGTNQLIYATNASNGYVTVTTLTIPAGALKFDPSLPAGDNSRLNYVNIANPFRAFQKEMTVEFWMYVPNANLPFGSVMGQGPSNLDQNYSWLMHPNTNGTMTFYVNDGGTLRGTNCTIIAGSWHHYAATSSATSTKFYVDGVLVHTGPGVSGNIVNDAASVIHIGKDVRYATRNLPNNDPTNRYATMTIDEVRIWSRELCGDEINNNKNCQLLNPAAQNGLEEYYTFNQGNADANNTSVTTLTDFSGKNRGGTLNNFTLTGTSSNWTTSGSTNNGTCAAYVASIPTITASGPTDLCAGSSVTLTASAGSSYLWSNGATTQSITVSQAGSYSVTVVSAGGCKASSAAKTVTVTTINNQPVAASATNLCGTGSSVITLASSQVGIKYTLRNNANNAIIAGPIAGTGGAINFNTGTISSTTTYNVLAESGPTGALNFNGSTYVTIPHSNNLNVSAGGQLTMEAWVNPAVSGQWRNILMKGAYGYGMAIDASNRLYFWDQGGGNAYDTWSNVTVPTNTWSHVAITVQDNGSSLAVTLYLNGVNVGNKTSPIAQINDNTASLIIGRQGTGCGCNYFNGNLDDVRIWNTVRSAAEIQASMNSCLAGTETGLVALYKMDDGNGTTVTDSKAANNGIITGTASWTSGNVVCGAVCSQQMTETPTVTVNALPTVNPVTNIEVCHNGIAVPAINFTGSVEDATYSWTNDNPAIGLSATGTGNIASFTAQNPGTVPVYANITVTPAYTLDGNTCTGTPMSFVIRVNPIPVINPIASQTLCNGAQSAVINITSPVPGATFRWTNLDPSVNIGLANGVGAVIPSFTAVNNTNQPINASYLVVSYFEGETGGCGTSRVVNFIVNPTPVITVTPNGPTSFCAGGSVTLTATAGTSYLWSNGQQTQSITVTQAGNYSVTVTSATGCSNSSAAVAVTVNALPTTPVIGTSGATTVCEGSPVTLTAPGGQTFGNSISFNGSNNNIVIPHNNSLNFTSQYTVESWINVSGYQYGTIISKFEDDNNNRSWMVNMGETGDPTKVTVVHSRFGSWTNPIQWNTGFQPALNTWYHIAVVFDASLSSNQIKLYVNGALTAQTSWPYTITPNTANMYIGGYDGPGNGLNGGANSRFFNGKIDEVRVWNLARTAPQISAAFNQPISASTPGLVAAYSFNETSGNTINDATGVNNGTMVNNPTRSTDAPMSASSGNNTYLWTTGATSQSIVATTPGNYAVTITNENGCSATSAPVAISNYAAPTISCPANITTTSLANQCGANVSYPNATVTAGPANPTVTYSHPSGSFFPVGTTTVTATVTDACGKQASCTFTVTVTDNINPVITAPTNIVVPAGVNCSVTGINLGTPVTSDNCSVATVTNNAPAVYPIGSTNVIWTVTDASGNTATATQTVTVVDQTAPVPNVATLPDINGECSVTVTAIPKATDNCNAQITATTTSPLSYNTQGTYTIVWKYTDAAGNFSTQTQTVVVKDVTPPVINCPAPITAIAPNNQCGAVVSFTQPTVSDNCSSGTTGVHTLTSGAQFFDYADNRMETQNSPGLPMTFFPTDGQKLAVFLVNCGSTHYMYQNITLPSSGPINLGLDMKYTNHYASGFSASQFIAIELRNPSTNAIIATLFKTNPGAAQSTPMTHYNFDLSAYAGQQVRLQVVDATINNFFLDVQLDNITIPGSSLVNGSFETGDYTGWSIGSASTTCGTFGIGSGPSVSVVQTAGLPSGSTFPIGTTTNTFEATDLAGNKSTCSFTVTVNAPEIAISGNGTEIVSGNNSPSASDNTDIGGTIPGNSISKTYVIANNGTSALTVSSINISNAAFTSSGISLPAVIQPGQSANFTLSFASTSLGVQTAVVTINNSDCDEAAYNFTVKAEVTCTNPVFVNTNAQVLANTTATTCNAVVNYPLSVTGIPAPGLSYTFSGATTGSGTGTGSGQTFNKGTTHVIVTAVNPCSTVVAEFDVIVSDITPPIAIAQNLTVSLNANGTAAITAAQINNGSSDNCGVASISLSKTSFDCSNVGTNNVILTVTDVNGNVSTATAVVTVIDDIKPSITAPAMVSVVNTPGSCMAMVDLGTPVTSDNCGVATVTNNAPALFPVGTTIVKWTVTDVHGNVTDTATQEVVVIDNENPTITVTNISVNNDAGKCYATVADVQPETADNCGVSSVVGVRSDSQPLNATYPVGTTTITWTVTDIHGNIKTAVQSIVVTDNEKPSITAPAMVSVVNIPGSCTASVNLGTPETSDNCGVATVTNNAPALFPVGTTIVRWTVTDIHGNVTDTATQEVVVIDNENPTIAVNNISVNNDAGKCYATVAVGQPETADNCGVSSVVGVRSDSQALNATYPVGTTTITWTVTDINGNIKTAVQSIVVTDNEKPGITAPAMVSVVNIPGSCTASVNLGTPETSDNCGVATVTNNAPALFPVGTTIVRWTVTDIHGNVTDTATQEVVVIDNENPTITVNNISVNNDAGKCGATLAISMPQTADNCGVATIMGARSDHKLLTEDYPVGTTIITWTVRDVNGNVKTATQTIVVTDNEKPVIACTTNQVFCANTGGNTQYTIPVLNQSDNCGIASTKYSITGATNRTGNGTNASGSFAIGTSTVTFTVTDIHGNVSTCSFNVTINPLPVASIAAPTADAFCNQFTLTANSTLSGPFTYQWLFGNTTKATTQQLSLGLTDADGVYSVYATDAKGCRSELPATYNYQKQTLVSSYTILATKEVKLGQYDKVESGSVGIMSSRGEAEFDKYSSVTGAGSFVKAPRIDTDRGVTINSKIYGVANVTLPAMQYNLSNTRYLQDKTVNANVTATVNGNYDEVTLKKGSNVTLTGTVFGKIKLEEGASVRFTSSTIDVAEIQIEKGPKSGGYSYIRFAPNTSIRVSKKVTIGSDVIVNPEAYQVTFYMADNRRDEEKFHVKGDDTRITANIILPDGKLKVTGGNYGDDRCDHRPHSSNSCRHKGHGHHDCDHRGHDEKDCRDDVYMTGLFIAEEVESEGKNVIWNSFSCGAGSAPGNAVVSSNNKATVTEEASNLKLQAASKSEEELKVTVMPNPTRTFFTIKLESKYDAPVTMRMVDASGRVVESRTKIGSNSTIQVGHNYNAGNYFAEFVQGNRRKTIQLIKVR